MYAMQPRFELNHLKYFYFTVLEGGVALAARKLCVQQPVVSKMLRQLEEDFAQPLFRKSGRKKALTDFGQLIYRHCQVVFRELERLESVGGKATSLAGTLNFGCSEAIANAEMARAVQKLTAQYPGLHPNLYTGTAQSLIDLIAQRKLEFGFFYHMPALPPTLEIIRRVPRAFNLVVSAKQKRNRKVIESFIGSREIDDTSTLRFPTIERMRKDYPGTKISLSSNNLHFHKELVMRGFGSSILPHSLVKNELAAKSLCDVFKGESFTFDLKIVSSRAEPLSLAAQEMVRFFLEVSAEPD